MKRFSVVTIIMLVKKPHNIQVSVFAHPHPIVPTSLVMYSCFVLHKCRSSVLDIVDTERKQVETPVHR